MKKMFLGSAAFLMFAIALAIFQAGCSKTEAQPSATAAQVGKLVYTKEIPGVADKEIWTCNYDGTNAVQVPIIYPPGLTWTRVIDWAGLTISPDGQKIFIVLSAPGATGTVTSYIYSYDITGGAGNLVTSGQYGKVHAY